MRAFDNGSIPFCIFFANGLLEGSRVFMLSDVVDDDIRDAGKITMGLHFVLEWRSIGSS